MPRSATPAAGPSERQRELPTRRGDGRLWSAYAGLCILSWMLYAMAGTEWQRGGGAWRLWDAAYEATWNLGPPMAIGLLALPWTRALQRRAWPLPANLLLHVAAGLAFALLWLAADFGLAWWFFGPDHASATFEQHLLWRTVWAIFIYTALVLGFGGALHARRAHETAMAAAQTESALVRAELAAISGKLNPHFLFNTLNSLHYLVRKDAQAAEQSLLRFARMMRYLLDSQRGAADRVPLQEELDFVRDYLALESLRLGQRLRVQWHIDDETLDDPIPPLTLQPLVENSILHGIAPRVEGGTVVIEAQRLEAPAALLLRVADDGAGCVWPPAAAAKPGAKPAPGSNGASAASGSGGSKGSGVGLSALRRRFELDFNGHASLDVQSAPGAGFRVEIRIPQTELQA